MYNMKGRGEERERKEEKETGEQRRDNKII